MRANTGIDVGLRYHEYLRELPWLLLEKMRKPLLDLLEVAGQGERSTWSIGSRCRVQVRGSCYSLLDYHSPHPTASLVAGATLSDHEAHVFHRPWYDMYLVYFRWVESL